MENQAEESLDGSSIVRILVTLYLEELTADVTKETRFVPPLPLRTDDDSINAEAFCCSTKTYISETAGL
jgi:hypothetical protein